MDIQKLVNDKRFQALLVVGIVACAGIFVWNVFDLGLRFRVASLIDDIEENRESYKARESLAALDDRGYVLEKLKQSLADDGTVQGKIGVLDTLTSLKEHRAVRRALDSEVEATRRAAAVKFYLRQDVDDDTRQRARDICLAWLQDEGADGRHLAAIACGQLQNREAIPALRKALDDPGADHQLTSQAIGALARMGAEGMYGSLMKIARDTSLDPNVRLLAYRNFSHLKDAPVDEVQALYLETVRDPQAPKILKNMSVTALGTARYAGAETTEALRSVLFAESQPEGWHPDQWRVLQRQTLEALIKTLPLDEVEKIILDRRVYTHPYYPVRVHVAVAIAILHLKKRLPYDILLNYLVDEDPQDTQFQVRRNAWLTLWMLTGFAYGVDQQELFRNRPTEKMTDDETIRYELTRASSTRYGVGPKASAALDKFVGNDAEMAKIRQVYAKYKDEFFADDG